MIYVKMVGGPVFNVQFSEGITAETVIQSIKDENSFEFRGNYTFQDTITGTMLPDTEILIDGRLYFLNVFALKRQQV